MWLSNMAQQLQVIRQVSVLVECLLQLLAHFPDSAQLLLDLLRLLRVPIVLSLGLNIYLGFSWSF